MEQNDLEPERYTNLFAPWRMEYIRLLGGQETGCFLCRAASQVGKEEENLVLWRTPRCIVIMNRFPYTGGHLLISPLAHVAGLGDLDSPTMSEIMEVTRDATRVLGAAVKAEGFNVGFNIGRCAGAGLPGHIHLHVVPRWSGDTNFMAVLGDVHMIPQALDELREELLKEGQRQKLPRAAYAQ